MLKIRKPHEVLLILKCKNYEQKQKQNKCKIRGTPIELYKNGISRCINDETVYKCSSCINNRKSISAGKSSSV